MIYAYIDPQNHPNVGIYGSSMECLGNEVRLTCRACLRTGSSQRAPVTKSWSRRRGGSSSAADAGWWPPLLWEVRLFRGSSASASPICEFGMFHVAPERDLHWLAVLFKATNVIHRPHQGQPSVYTGSAFGLVVAFGDAGGTRNTERLGVEPTKRSQRRRRLK